MNFLHRNILANYQSTNILFAFFLLVYFAQAQENINEHIKKLNEVINYTYKNHYNKNQADQLVDAAIKGIIKELDPHSYYFTKEQLKGIEERRNGNTIGVGVEYSIFNDTIVVVSMLPNSPSRGSNMQLGDKIVKVDGKSVTGENTKKFDDLVRGDRGTNISFDVIRGKNQTASVKMKRTRIPLYSVDAAYMIEETDIGYVSMNRFMSTSYMEMIDSLDMLSNLGMKKLIFDLRNNGGGFLDQAYMIADEFIKNGSDIVYLKGRRAEFNENYQSTPGGKYENLPLIVLIDANTASAPEIIAGAIQDLDRGLVIGETSFGKGLVQRPYKLVDGTELWLTVAQYFTPAGRCIQKNYKNNENYGTLADRINLEEGFNMKHELELIEFTSDSVPVYRTLKGRPVLGGGGITPDYIIKNDSLTDFSKSLIDKKIIQKLALKYVNNNRGGLRSANSQLENLNIEKDILKDLKEILAEEKMDFKENDFQTDLDSITINLKATLGGMMVSNVQKSKILNKSSKHIKKAIELFPVAENLIK